MKERERAINKFLDSKNSKLQFGDAITSGIDKYPELLRDAEVREFAFNAALLRHKLILLSNGLSYGEVYSQSQKIQQSTAERNGKGRFINTINETWSNMFGGETLNTLPSEEKQVPINDEIVVDPNTTKMEPNKEINLT